VAEIQIHMNRILKNLLLAISIILSNVIAIKVKESAGDRYRVYEIEIAHNFFNAQSQSEFQ